MLHNVILAINHYLVPDNLPLYNRSLMLAQRNGWQVTGPAAGLFLLSLVQAVVTRRLFIRWRGAYRIWWTRHGA